MNTFVAKRRSRGEWIARMDWTLRDAARLANYAIGSGVLAYLAWIVASWIAGVVTGWVFA
jgi:hypothetical protein